MTSLALEVINTRQVDVIIGIGLIPYLVSAYTASIISGIEYYYKQSEDDLKYLSHSYLSCFLANVISSSRGIIGDAFFREGHENIIDISELSLEEIAAKISSMEI